MDIEDSSSAHHAPGLKDGGQPYSYDLRNPFYHLTDMANFPLTRSRLIAAYIPLALAVIFIGAIMYVVG